MENIITPFKMIYNSFRFKGISSLLTLCIVFNISFARENTKPLSLGTVADFKNSFSKIEPAAKKLYALKLESNREVQVQITANECRKNDCYIFGNVIGHEQSTFFIRENGKGLNGKVIFQKTKEAYDIYTSENGEIFIAPVDIHDVICIDYNKYEGEEEAQDPNAQAAQKGMETMVIPMLNSLPGAYGTIYLDFNGENLTGSNWGNINAVAPSFSDANITTIWTAIAEDFSPFNMNITTDLAVFNAAAANRRMQVIFTPTNTAAPGAGGVAYLGSFGSGEPCWVFNPQVKAAFEAATHETGHTLGLSHDGTISPLQEYYGGHVRWGPVMGATYSYAIVQWSKGEYTSASNTQLDLTIINNKVPYRTDDAGNDPANAKAMVVSTGGVVASSSNYGIIERNTDKDVYSFTTTGGTVTFTITPKTQSGSASIPNLDIQARLLNSAGTEIVKADTPAGSTITAATTINQTLTAGTYYLEIDGVGYLSPLNTGYSDYGSLGQYFIAGNISGGSGGGQGINDLDIVHSINVFPNPSAGIFTINAALEGNNQSTLEIINSLGQPVLVSVENTSGAIRKEVDLSGHAAGIYYIMLRSGNDVWKGKVILQ